MTNKDINFYSTLIVLKLADKYVNSSLMHMIVFSTETIHGYFGFSDHPSNHALYLTIVF